MEELSTWDAVGLVLLLVFACLMTGKLIQLIISTDRDD